MIPTASPLPTRALTVVLLLLGLPQLTIAADAWVYELHTDFAKTKFTQLTTDTVGVSPDGTRVACQTELRKLQVRDATLQKPLITIDHTNAPWILCLANKKYLFVSDHVGKVTAYDYEKGKRLWESTHDGSNKPLHGLRMAPKGKYVVTTGTKAVVILDGKTGRATCPPSPFDDAGFASFVKKDYLAVYLHGEGLRFYKTKKGAVNWDRFARPKPPKKRRFRGFGANEDYFYFGLGKHIYRADPKSKSFKSVYSKLPEEGMVRLFPYEGGVIVRQAKPQTFFRLREASGRLKLDAELRWAARHSVRGVVPGGEVFYAAENSWNGKDGPHVMRISFDGTGNPLLDGPGYAAYWNNGVVATTESGLYRFQPGDEQSTSVLAFKSGQLSRFNSGGALLTLDKKKKRVTFVNPKDGTQKTGAYRGEGNYTAVPGSAEHYAFTARGEQSTALWHLNGKKPLRSGSAQYCIGTGKRVLEHSTAGVFCYLEDGTVAWQTKDHHCIVSPDGMRVVTGTDLRDVVTGDVIKNLGTKDNVFSTDGATLFGRTEDAQYLLDGVSGERLGSLLYPGLDVWRAFDCDPTRTYLLVQRRSGSPNPVLVKRQVE
ncbi:MAG: PQQ-binding-like beta-propeller repeat protein [Planctomycetota bacterium]